MTDKMLREQARQFAPRFDVPSYFRYSNGWLANFKERHGIDQEAVPVAIWQTKRCLISSFTSRNA
jgi:hypothetical protein